MRLLSVFSSKTAKEEKLKCKEKNIDQVAFKVYNIGNDGKLKSTEIYEILKLMVGSNMSDYELQEKC